jgi:septal ring factor EnvC (AmiA/AmiB activator)
MASLLRHIPHRPRVQRDDDVRPSRPRQATKVASWCTIVAVVFALLTQQAGAAGIRTDAVIDQAQAQKDQIRQQKAALASQLDTAKASTEDVAAALTALDQQVASQQAQVNESQRAIDAAERRIAELDQQLQQNKSDVDRIAGELRDQALRRYVKPEGDVDSTQLLKSDNFDDAEQRKALAEMQWGSSHDSIDQLRGAKAKLADLQAQSDAARKDATDRKADQQSQLDSLNSSRAAQARVKAEWDNRVSQMEGSEQSLNAADAQLTQLIQSHQATLDQQAAAAKAAQQRQAQQAQAVSAPRASSTGTSGGSSSGNSGSNGGGGGGGGSIPPSAPPSTGGGMIWPIAGRVSQEFGHNGHPGIDIFAPLGTPIWAAKGGTVIYAQMNDGGYGNLVLIDNGGGIVTAYAHQSQILVSVGQSVSQGQTIGLEGSTGNSTGPHLHFEVRVNGSVQNPRNYLS